MAGVAAGVDDEIADFRLRAGAADRAIERDVAGPRSARSAVSLSAIVKVLSSMIVRGQLRRDDAATIAGSATGFGRLVRMTGAGAPRRRFHRDLGARLAWPRAARRDDVDSRSRDSRPAARFPAKAPPMMPRPMTPTVPLRRLAATIQISPCQKRKSPIQLPRPSYALAPSPVEWQAAFTPRRDRLSSPPGGAMQVGVAGIGAMGSALAARASWTSATK